MKKTASVFISAILAGIAISLLTILCITLGNSVGGIFLPTLEDLRDKLNGK